MHHFDYTSGVLHAEGVNLAKLAQDVGTPYYCYSDATLVRHYKVFSSAFTGLDSLVCYSVKANSNVAVLKTLAREGAGMDVVSGGELRRARAAGVAGNKIIFSGVGKTAEEMAFALDEGIFCFNVESEGELELLSEVATSHGKTAAISLRINPDVDPRTHHKISTGKADDKFGIPWLDARRLYAKAAALRGLKVTGVDIHIGSQITALRPFADAFKLIADLVGELRSDGFDIDHIDIGGGLGIPYEFGNSAPPHPDEYAKIVKETLGGLGCKLISEPGRLIAGNAGILVTRVLYIKSGAEKTFTIVDAAMNDLIRPTLYDAYQEIWPVDEIRRSEPPINTDVVGPICETGDFFAIDRPLPAFKQGDLMAIMTAGAYGAVQSCTYNSRPLIPEILVKGEDYAVIRPRQSYDEMLAQDHIPHWFT